MLQSNLQKLSVTLVLLAATAFVSVTAVAADPWYPVKASDAAAASSWFDTHPGWILSDDAAMSTLQPTLDSARLASLNGGLSAGLEAPMQPTLDSARLASLNGERSAGLAMLANPHNRWIGPETVSAALGQSAALSTLGSPSGHWIGPGTVSAALLPLDNSNGHWIGPETVSAALGQLQP